MLLGSQPRRVAIVGGVRIPFARAHGAYAEVGNRDLLTQVLRGLVERFALQGECLGDVAAGAVIRHSSEWNLAREAVLGSGLAAETPAFDLQRACGTSLEAAILIANRIALGQIDSGIAAGADTTSDPPISYPHAYQRLLLRSLRARSLTARLRPWLSLRPRHLRPVLPGMVESRTGMSMGESCEQMAREWEIGRAEQDAFALESHRRAARACDAGFHDDLLIEYQGLRVDDNLRRDASIEKLAALPPSFAVDGTLTAGNSAPLCDGAAGVLLASEDWARARNLPVLAHLTAARVAAVDFVRHDGLLMAPAFAVPRLLADKGLTLQDFDFYEFHEAFAAQLLCTLKAWQSDEFCRDSLGLAAPPGAIDRERLNVNGGSLAMGHPLAATGARMLAALAKALAQRGSGCGLLSVCTAGGMGVAAIVER